MKQNETCLCGCFVSEEDENDPDSKPAVCKIEKKFIESTSCHGISYWCSSTNDFQRIAWIILVLGATAGLIQQVYTRVDNYFLYETSTEVSREFVNQIDFPAVTFCNYNRYFSSSKLNTDVPGFHLLNRITSPLFIAFAQDNGISVPLTALDSFDSISNFTISGYLDEKGYQLVDGDTLHDCRFRSKKCLAEDFKPVVTRMGKCYTFNANTSTEIQQNVAGFGQGLSLTLNVKHLQYTEEPLYGQQEAGIMFQVHSKHDPPNVDRHGLAIPVGQKAFAVVSRKDSEIMYAPWGQCYPDIQKTLKYFQVYSITACMQECYTDLLIAQCGCRTFEQYWAADYASECTTHQVSNCSTPYANNIESTLTPQACQCTVPCSFTEFTTIPSYATSPGLKTRQLYEGLFGFSAAANIIQQNFVSLDVTFTEIGYSKETQSKKVEIASLTSDVGGQLGLWIGMSVLTVAEFFQYFLIRIWKSCKGLARKFKGKKNKVDDIISKPTLNGNLTIIDY